MASKFSRAAAIISLVLFSNAAGCVGTSEVDPTANVSMTRTTTTSTTTTTITSTMYAETSAPTTRNPSLPEPTSCVRGFPTGVGVDTSNCNGKVGGQTCSVTCSGAYEGESRIYACNDEGLLQPVASAISCSKKTCTKGLPGSPYNISACSGTEINQSCAVSCNAGFKDAQFVFVCDESGSFSGSVEPCEQVTCLGEGMPTGRGVNSSSCLGILAGQSCNSVCDDGYDGVSAEVQCGNDGVLHGSTPACVIGTCNISAGLLEAGIVHNCESDGVKVAHGEGCVAVCAEGYEGQFQSLLCNAPTLEGSVPSCTATECTRNIPFGPGLNATDCGGMTTGSACDISCADGFAPSAGSPTPAVATCFANGTFGEHGLTCAPKACDDLSSVAGFDNGSIDTSACSSIIHRETCSVTCADGYDPESRVAQPLTCHAVGFPMTAGGFVNEMATAPSAPLGCIARKCTFNLPSKRGVHHDCADKRTGDTCVVQSRPGFQYSSSSTAKNWTCNADGVFNGTLPDLQPAVCTNFTSLGEGVATTCASKAFNTSCWTYCSTGYTGNFASYECALANNESSVELTLMSDASTTCQANQQGRRLSLEAALPAEPRRLAVNCDSDLESAGLTAVGLNSDCRGKSEGDTCLVECATGYAITGDPSTYTCTAGGTFTGSGLPTCSPNTCSTGFPNGKGVTSNCSGAVTGGTCTASCDSGYSGASEELTCQATGELSGASPSCMAAECDPLNEGQAFRTTQCQGKTTGQTCVVDCADGWALNGDASQYECTATGFSGTLPQCKPKLCTGGIPLGDDLKVQATCSSLNTSQVCEVACADGYEGVASNFTCSTKGELEGTRPTCQLRTCPNTVPTSGGVSNECDNIIFGSKCFVGCAAGYRPKTSSVSPQWQCAFDADSGDVKLQGTVPECEPIPCEYQIPMGATLIQNCSGVGTGGECVARCIAGYSGAPQVYVCGSDQTFTGAPPACVPTPCPPRTEARVEDDCASTAFGMSCLATCADGFSGTAQPWKCEVQTETDGLWNVFLNGSNPTCTPKACLYNFPVAGAGYSHDCDGKVSDETCTVSISCAAPLIGESKTWTCGKDQALQGMLPACNQPAPAGRSPDGTDQDGTNPGGSTDGVERSTGLSMAWIVIVCLLSYAW